MRDILLVRDEYAEVRMAEEHARCRGVLSGGK